MNPYYSTIGLALLSLLIIRWGIRRMDGWHYFRATDNPYRRVCKRCEAVQEVFESTTYEPVDGIPWPWWEETHEGNNPACKCHKYAENHEH